MKRLGPACTLMLVAVATAAVAQEKPDFSGRWILVTPSNEGFARELTVSYGYEERIRALIVARQFASDRREDTYKLGVGGGSGGGMAGSGFVGPWFSTTFSVEWADDGLAITTSRDAGSTPTERTHTEHKETWSLTRDGRLVIFVSDQTVGDSPITTVLTYRKAG